MDVASAWPPGLTKIAFYRCPPWLREDALQAAWEAHLSGEKPDTAVRRMVRREIRQAAATFDSALISRVVMVW